MPGLYFHIPFCRRACTYCDFHFSTSLRTKEPVLAAMHRELAARAPELASAPLGSIYFGGGTPSILSAEELGGLIRAARGLAAVEPDAEITLEANPDDATEAALEAWQQLGINRVSLGIQSFREDRLRWMNRSHDAASAQRAIRLVSRAGLRTWTIDLIYGLPGMGLAEWDEQLAIALGHGMPHLSAYCLTVEGKTALAHQVRKGMAIMPDDEAQSAQFDLLMERMEAAGLEHYEISNFARPGHRARHNAAYWEGAHYVGIGPAAHSYDGLRRRWNAASNARYIKGVADGAGYWEQEALTAAQRVNEMLLTGLRTSAGVELARLGEGAARLQRRAVDRWVASGHLVLAGGRLALTKAGRHFADRIASDLFVPEDDR